MFLVSVIIPVYNAGRYIARSVASVLAQTYSNFELIIIDDGSTDNSLSIIQSIRDDRLRIYCKPNEGQCKTLNYGLSLARGQYIKFLDADDLLNETHLEKMMTVIEALPEAEKESTLVISKWQRFSGENTMFPLIERPEWVDCEPVSFIIKALGNGPDMLPAWQWLIPSKLLSQSGYWNETLGLGNDFEFSVRLILASERIRICKEAFVYYRSDLTGNMSSSKSRETILSVLAASRMGIIRILAKDNSLRVRKVCADKLQIWLLSYYPYIRGSIIEEVEKEIKALGGSDANADWDRGMLFLKKVLGWKKARWIQYYYYKLFY